MSKAKIVAFGLVIGCLALPAFAQSTNACAGQPWTGSAFGSVAPFAVLAPATGASFTPGDGASCNLKPSASDVDAIWCFTPANSCSPTFVVNGAAGGELMSFNLYSGGCVAAPTSANCVGGMVTSAGGSISMMLNMTGGQQYCAYHSTSLTTVSNAMASIVDATSACGNLPVEIQKFTINEKEAKSKPKK